MVTGLCVGLLLVTCIAVVSPGPEIQIEGTYRELWNQTLDGSIAPSRCSVIAVDDFDCDGKTDFIVTTTENNTSPPPNTNITIVALKGKNGSELWQWNTTAENPSLSVYPVKDMDCDGKTDVVIRIDEWNTSTYKLLATTVIALGGKDGATLWPKPMTFVNYSNVVIYPVDDLNCDNKTDIILRTSRDNGTETLSIIALVGMNGTELWNWSKSNSSNSDYIMFSDFYPVDDLNCDGKNDLVFSVGQEYPDKIVYVLDGRTGDELWNETFLWNSPDVYTVDDLNCDNKTDILLETQVSGYPYDYLNLRALMGNGTLIWVQNVTNATSTCRVDDFSCDGKTDIFVGRDDGVTALVGKTGQPLWEWTAPPDTYGYDIFDLYGVDTFPIDDVSCDGKTDVIWGVSGYNTSAATVLLWALSGADKAPLWNWSINKTDWKIWWIEDVISVADMDCDGKSDVIVLIKWQKPGVRYTWTIMAINGKDGTVLWQKEIALEQEINLVYVFPVDDVTCDGKTDIILKMAGDNWTTYISNIYVEALVGKNGTILWGENMTGVPYGIGIDIYFGGDFSCDGKTDIILNLIDNTNGTNEIKVKEGKTGSDVINFSSASMVYPAIFYEYQVKKHCCFGDSYGWDWDEWLKYDATCDNNSDLVVGGGREVYAVTKLIPPQGDSSEDDRTIKNNFFVDEDVYAIGGGFEPLDWINISVVQDMDWMDGDPILADVSSDGVNTVQADANGSVFALVWPQPLTVGDYDIVFDADQNGTYDFWTDGVDSASPGFVVQERPAAITKAVPVLTTLGLGLLMAFMVLVAVLRLKRRPENK